MNRRDFINNIALAGGSALLFMQTTGTAKGGPTDPPGNQQGLIPAESRQSGSPPRELTVAGLQMLQSADVEANERAIHRAIDQAAGAKADFLLTPEGSLSGYYPGFDRAAVATAVERVARHAKESQVGLLLGTCYKELEEDVPALSPLGGEAVPHDRREYCYDQVRIYAPNGDYLGAHSKILLCSSLHHPGSGELQSYVGGTLQTFAWGGIRFGVLICNDLWATPGFTTLPNPYLAWQLRTLGAQLIYHAVATAGTPVFFRPYHELNQALWAKALKIPIVTTNLTDGITPSACRAGVVGPDGEHKCMADDVGERFFSCRLTVA